MPTSSESKTVIDTDSAYQLCLNLARQVEAQPTNSQLLHNLATLIRTVTDQPVDQFVQILIENDYFIKSSLFPYYEYLYIENEATLVVQLLDTASGRLAVAEHVEKLKTVHAQDIADKLSAVSDYQALSALCSREVNINHQKVVTELLAQGDFRTIARDIDSYYQIDFSQIYTSFFAEDNMMPINEKRPFLYLINAKMHLWQDCVTEAELDILSADPSFFYNADKWSERIANSPKLKQIFLRYEKNIQEKIILETCDNYNFIGVKRLLLLSNAEIFSGFSEKIDSMKLQHTQFIVAGKHQLAQDLSEVIQLFDQAFEANTEVPTYPQKMTMTEPRELRERLPICDIRKLAIDFYIHVYFEYQASKILHLQLQPTDVVNGLRAQEREFSKLLDRAAFAHLLFQSKKSVENAFRYVRQFVFIQVQHEAASTNGYKVPVNVRSEVSFSDKQIVDYLARMKQLFSLMRNGSLFGGEAWAAVADLGLQSWQLTADDTNSRSDVSKVIGLTDRIFQVHHNTGSVFNKNSKIHFHDSLQKVFDFFAQESDLDEMLAFAVAQGCFTQPEIIEMRRKQNLLQRLQKASVKTKTD